MMMIEKEEMYKFGKEDWMGQLLGLSGKDSENKVQC